VSSLPDDWLAAWVGAGRVPGASGVVEIVVSGAPEGQGTWVVRVDDGVVTDAVAGPPADPDVTLTIAYADALAIAEGRLDPSVAFMQGRLKTAGDPGLVLDVLAAAAMRR
jgi:hypothetical protein